MKEGEREGEILQREGGIRKGEEERGARPFWPGTASSKAWQGERAPVLEDKAAASRDRGEHRGSAGPRAEMTC